MKGLIAVLFALVILGLAFFLYSSPSAPPETTEAEIAQIQSEVGAVGDQWMAAVNGIDVGAAGDLFDPADTHCVDGGYYANYDEWQDHLEALFSTWEDMNLAWTSTRVDVFAPDAAVFVGEGEGVATRTNGVFNLRAGVTLLLKKTQGIWRITFQGSAGRWTPVVEG